MKTTVLAIESSCDESAVSIVDEDKNILFNRVFSQDHRKYNGVYPEIAAREHLKILPNFIKEGISEFDVNKITSIAVTTGPGLIGSLIVGIMLARGLGLSLNKPVIPINHLEGHVLSVRLTEDIDFPFLLLLISGGHSKIIEVLDLGNYNELGSTIDDAFGEAFDKVAKMLGLPYPGGIEIEKRAKFGNKDAFLFPRSMVDKNNCDFSLSGIKTSVMHTIEKISLITDQNISDICASFQECISDIIINKLKNAIKTSKCLKIVAAGGVASNLYIRNKIIDFGNNYNLKVYFPPVEFCTDNAAMIAWAAIEKIKCNNNKFINQSLEPQPRWELS
jgi:N6-L-threonylcarbamoyladenine synthase